MLTQLDTSLQLSARVLARVHPGLTLAERPDESTSSATRYVAEDLLTLMVALRSTIALYAKLVRR